MKSGGLTQSHLRFGDMPIRSTYLVSSADFVACHAPTYVKKYDLTEDLKDGGTFLLNCPWTTEELEEHLPAKMKRDLARKHAQFYIIDAAKLAAEIGLGKHTNNILQGAFFALTKVIPMDVAVADMKKNNYATYFKKAGQKIVDLNDKAVDVGVNAAVKVDIPAAWADAQDAPAAEIQRHALCPRHRAAHGSAAGRQTARVRVPEARRAGRHVGERHLRLFQARCGHHRTQVGRRGMHPVQPLRHELSPRGHPPGAADRGGKRHRCPPDLSPRPPRVWARTLRRMPSGCRCPPYDCLGCGVCLTACPAKGALTMAPFEEMKAEQPLFDQVAMDEKYLKKDVISDKSVKSAQFAKPYFQFSAACAGCAETTYIKLLSQLFGDHMYVGNAAGCSSAISGGAPILPYCKDCQGHGPAWEHSLFEDNAEFAYGFFHAQDAIRRSCCSVWTPSSPRVLPWKRWRPTRTGGISTELPCRHRRAAGCAGKGPADGGREIHP